MKPEAHRLDPATYPSRLVVPVRFGDLDPLGHVNNVSFGSYVEEGRAALNRLAFPKTMRQEQRLRIVIADVHIAYLAEAHYPGEIEVLSGVGHIGRSSYRIDSALFQKGQCIAVAESVLVNTRDQVPASLPQSAREALETVLTRPA